MNIFKTKKFKIILTTAFTIMLIAAGSLWWFSKDTREVKAGWWNESWSYRKAIVINSAKVTADLTDFPMLVSLTDTNLGAKAQASGNDIVFIDTEGKKLSHEIESFASSTGELVAWVRIPNLSSTADETIYMYYGNASAPDQQDAVNVWDENYMGVWHMGDPSPDTIYDSTGNGNTGRFTSSSGQKEAGKIGQSLYLDGTEWQSVWLDASESIEMGKSDMTISTWVNLDPSSASYEYIINIGDGWNNGGYLIAYDLDLDRFVLSVHNGLSGTGLSCSSPSSLENAGWHFVSFVINRSSGFYCYYNGSLYASDETSILNGTHVPIDGYINIYGGGPEAINGHGDEFRISKTARSAAWIATEYANQNDPASFLSIQEEEVGPGPVGWWSFDEGYGDTAHDGSGQGNHGTITGATWQDESMCVSRKCLYFDGSGDYVEIPDIDL